MGLDITAYEGLTKAKPGEGLHPEYPDEPDYTNGYHRMYLNRDFPVPPEIEHGAIYKAANEFGFRAGSYSSYNGWRRELASMVGTTPEAVWKNPKPGPFMELINFSDCEGVLGKAVCAKLSRDFEEWQSRAELHAKTLAYDGEWFLHCYSNWRKAFEMGRNNGCVSFH